LAEVPDHTDTVQLPPHLAPRPDQRLPTFRLLASLDDPVNLDNTRQFLQALARLHPGELVFSLIGNGTAGDISLTISIAETLYTEFEQALLSYYPYAQLEPVPLEQPPTEFNATAEYRMDWPVGALHAFTDFIPDPFALLCSSLQNLTADELAMFCVEFSPSRIPRRQWGPSPPALRDTSREQQKAQQPLWAVGLKILVAAGGPPRANAILQSLDQHLGQFNEPHTRLVRWTVAQEEDYLSKAGGKQTLSEFSYTQPPQHWKKIH
jgi:hypothetical protein